MNLVSIRIITDKIEEVVAFYEKITQTSIVMYTPEFGELHTPNSTLAIGSTKTLQAFGNSNFAQPGQNHSAIIEFLVEDVDKDFERLKNIIGAALIQAPTTMPWGNRSLLFKDPDGNLVNFFTPTSPEAKEKFKVK